MRDRGKWLGCGGLGKRERKVRGGENERLRSHDVTTADEAVAGTRRARLRVVWRGGSLERRRNGRGDCGRQRAACLGAQLRHREVGDAEKQKDERRGTEDAASETKSCRRPSKHAAWRLYRSRGNL